MKIYLLLTLFPLLLKSQYAFQTEFERLIAEKETKSFSIEISDAFQKVDLTKVALMYRKHHNKRIFGLGADFWGNSYYLENNWFGYYGIRLNTKHSVFIQTELQSVYIPHHKQRFYQLSPGAGYQFKNGPFQGTIQFSYQKDLFRGLKAILMYQESNWYYSLLFNENEHCDFTIGVSYKVSKSYSLGFALNSYNTPLQINFSFQPTSKSSYSITSVWKKLIGIQNYAGARFYW